MIWTTKDDTALRKLWADKKLSTREMGLRLGRSKNAVIGRANRLGLAARAKSRPPKPVNDKPKRPAYYNWNKRAEIAGKIYGSGKPLIDLEHDECRWPVGDIENGITFCAAKIKPGKPYCEKHHACASRVIQPTEPHLPVWQQPQRRG